MTILCDLARKHETDKGGSHFRYGGGDSDTCHNYTPEYHAMFGEDRADVEHVLEIGVNAGSSLRMWADYFANAEIVGLDSNAECMKHTDPTNRIKVLMADQGDPLSLLDALAKLPEGSPKFDAIIDDGSHERNHQIVSMQTLLPFMAPWGYYVIEDIGTWPSPPPELPAAVPPGFVGEYIKVTGGLGPKVYPHEWLFVVRYAQ